MAKRLIKANLTSWEELESKGKCLPRALSNAVESWFLDTEPFRFETEDPALRQLIVALNTIYERGLATEFSATELQGYLAQLGIRAPHLTPLGIRVGQISSLYPDSIYQKRTGVRGRYWKMQGPLPAEFMKPAAHTRNITSITDINRVV